VSPESYAAQRLALEDQMQVLLADGNLLLREALASLIDRSRTEIELVTAANLDEVLVILEMEPLPDAVVLEHDLSGMEGPDDIARIMALAPSGHVGVISGTPCSTWLRDMISKGGISLIPKTISAEQFIEVIKFISNGGLYLPLDIFKLDTTVQPPPRQELGTLTPRELEVLSLLCGGLSNKEISNQLGIEDVTVRLHLRGVFRKLGVKNRVQAVTRSIDLGLKGTSSDEHQVK